jgi:hypothetical protein
LATRYLGLTLAVVHNQKYWGAYVQEPRSLFRLVGVALSLADATARAVAAANDWSGVRRLVTAHSFDRGDTEYAWLLDAIDDLLGPRGDPVAPRTGTW